MILVTGGAGFIGSNFVQNWLTSTEEKVINLDKLTYAGNKINLDGCLDNPNHIFIEGDIGDSEKVLKLLKKNKPRAVINFAAESHVDRSIELPSLFFETNVMGSVNLIQAIIDNQPECKLMFCSSVEVYGNEGIDRRSIKEENTLLPANPYGATKSAIDLYLQERMKNKQIKILLNYH